MPEREDSAATADLLWRFDDELGRGVDPDWESILRQCPDGASRASLYSDMIRCEVDHRGWSTATVRSRLRRYAEYDSTEAGAAAVLRGIYTDRVDAGQTPPVSDFEPLGISFEVLQLRTADESVYLGQTIADRFRIEQRLGAGSYGVVYRANDSKAGQLVAIKTVKCTGDETEKQARQLLAAEAETLAKMPIAGIPRFIDFIDGRDGPPVLVQELVNGRPLHALLNDGSLTSNRAAKIIAQLADTLHFVHRQGFLHRDLSTSNILIDQTDTAFLTDFGFGLSSADLFDLDRHVAGTRRYMSVESSLGATREIDARDDIYALGVILFELLTGPCECAVNTLATARERTCFVQNKLADSNLNIPNQLARICRMCVADSADGRYDTAAIVARDLRAFLGEPLPPVDEARIRLAQRRLLAWRAGMRVGCACRIQNFIFMRLTRMRAATTEEEHRRDDVGFDLMLTSAQELVNQYVSGCEFAGKLDLLLADVPGVIELWSIRLSKERPPASQLQAWLSRFSNGAARTLHRAFNRLESHLSADGPQTVAVLQLGMLCGALAVAPTLSQTIAQLTTAAKLPPLCTLRFVDAISTDYGEQLDVRLIPEAIDTERDRLNMSAQRELSCQLADTLAGYNLPERIEPASQLAPGALFALLNSVPNRELYG